MNVSWIQITATRFYPELGYRQLLSLLFLQLDSEPIRRARKIVVHPTTYYLKEVVLEMLV